MSPKAGLSEGPAGRGLRWGKTGVWSTSFTYGSQMRVTCLDVAGSQGFVNEFAQALRCTNTVTKSLISPTFLTFILGISETRFASRPA